METGQVTKKTFEDVPIDVDADRFFKAWMDHVGIAPKIFTDHLHMTSCAEGNHLVEGGVLEMVYASDSPLLAEEKTSGMDVTRHTLVDYEKRLNKYEFLKGELKDKCTFYRVTLEVVPDESGTKCIVKRYAEFCGKDDAGPSPCALQNKGIHEYFQRVEQYLKANPTEYTT